MAILLRRSRLRPRQAIYLAALPWSVDKLISNEYDTTHRGVRRASNAAAASDGCSGGELLLVGGAVDLEQMNVYPGRLRVLRR